MTFVAYIALGSNLGDRHYHLDNSLTVINEIDGVTVERVSSYYETEPVGGPPGQIDFLNAVARIQTVLSPEQLLEALLWTEQKFGRVRSVKNAPRTLDLDVLLYDDWIIDTLELTLPHPRLHERAFVLQPLAEIAPQLVHPVLKKTMHQLLDWIAQVQPLNRPIPHILGPWPHDACQADPRPELAGLRAMVTGSTSGIGRAIAIEFAAAGADVIVHGGRSRLKAEQTAALCRVNGGESDVILADLRVADECERLFEAAWAKKVDIWINNAGADTLTGEAGSWNFERKLAELWTVDVEATIRLSRSVGDRMKKGEGGVIVNMGWDQAETGMEGDSGQLFAATKSAIMAFSKSLALTLAPKVRVNCLAPGWIRTAWGDQASDPWQERVRRETPLDRWGTPKDVAKAARWLVSSDAAFITGQVIRVNGGAVR